MYRKIFFPRALEYFLTIVEHGSFSRAAEVLHVSQPSLSQQIKQLEETLEAQLLIRGRTVRLTSAGEIYLGFAKRARTELTAGARAVNDVQDLSKGTLRLGWTPITDHLTYELIESFHHRYPGIVLSTLEMSQEYLEQAVTEGSIDIGIAFTTPTLKSTSTPDHENHIMFRESLYLAVGNSHPLACYTQGKIPSTEAALDMVLLNQDFALRQHIDDYCKTHSLTLQISMETNSLSVLLELTESGKLVTILPRSIIDKRMNLHSIKLETEPPQHEVSIIWHRHGYMNPACAEFIEMASDWNPEKNREQFSPSGNTRAGRELPVLPTSFFQ